MANITIDLTPINGYARKAFFRALIYNAEAKTVTTQWVVKLVEDVEIGLDEEENPIMEEREITQPWYKSYTKEFIADESVMVNPSTGAIIEEGQSLEGAVTEWYFFSEVVANNPTVVNDLIETVGNAKAALGKFEFQ